MCLLPHIHGKSFLSSSPFSHAVASVFLGPGTQSAPVRVFPAAMNTFLLSSPAQPGPRLVHTSGCVNHRGAPNLAQLPQSLV